MSSHLPRTSPTLELSAGRSMARFRHLTEWRHVVDVIFDENIDWWDAVPLLVQVARPESLSNMMKAIRVECSHAKNGKTYYAMLMSHLRRFIEKFDLDADYSGYGDAHRVSFLADGKLTPHFKAGMVFLKSLLDSDARLFDESG